MAQMMRAILLASATAASFFGWRASNPSSQGAVRPGLACWMTAVAPSTSSRRRVSSPCRLIRPGRCLPPVEFSRGVMPIQAAKCRPERKALGSGTLRVTLTPPIGPTPGIVVRHWLAWSCRCQAISRASIAFSFASKAVIWPASRSSISRARAGTPASAATRSSSTATRSGPPLSRGQARWPR